MDRDVDLRLSRVHYPITVLGPGRRIGIWFQGCTIGCPGCMSQDTWDPSMGEAIGTSELCDIVLAARTDEALDGVTISGGEPFQQADALHALCSELRRRWPHVDLLVYSGYPLARLRRLHVDVLELIDAVVAEPFMAARPTRLPWRGSANQELTLLSSAAQARYAEASSELHAPRVQVAVDEEGLWIAGIPLRGDLVRMRDDLHRRGLELEEVSWTT